MNDRHHYNILKLKPSALIKAIADMHAYAHTYTQPFVDLVFDMFDIEYFIY